IHSGEEFCWQHAKSWPHRFKSFTSNQRMMGLVGIGIGLLGIVLTIAFGVPSLRFPQHQQIGPAEPTLFLSCEIIPPVPWHQTIAVLETIPELPMGLFQLSNESGDSQRKWPDGGELIASCRLSNFGDTPVFSLETNLSLVSKKAAKAEPEAKSNEQN